jgi:hypothetical protein
VHVKLTIERPTTDDKRLSELITPVSMGQVCRLGRIMEIEIEGPRSPFGSRMLTNCEIRASAPRQPQVQSLTPYSSYYQSNKTRPLSVGE